MKTFKQHVKDQRNKVSDGGHVGTKVNSVEEWFYWCS